MRGEQNKKVIMNNNIKCVGVVAPSFFIEKYDNYNEAMKYFKEQNIKVVLGKTVEKRLDNTTGTAKQRAADINEMYANPEVDLIIASDGGCRALEVLEYLDYNLIKQNQKTICGFSDITHILLAIFAKTGNKAIHGIDIINGFGERESFVKEENIRKFWENYSNNKWCMDISKCKVLKEGYGQGVAIGGWINAISNLVNTDYFPKDKKIVLLWEAVDEEPNRINMMLQSLRISGLFSRVSGMIVGKLTNCIEKEYYDCVQDIKEMILSVCEGYDFPILIDAPFGHSEEKITFTYGNDVTINTEEK